jgi:hypothetical protein
MMRERDIAEALAEREGGQCEVKTSTGRIDVLTPKYLYEVKVARHWKAALGQVLAYARAYPDRKPRLYLFGERGAITKKDVEEHCRAAGVGVVWHREEDAVPRAPKEPTIIPDAMRLHIEAIDARYGIRAGPTIRLPTPTAPIAREALEAYADEALAVFDPLLDNALTITVTASYGGEEQVVERTRESRPGAAVCYQLHLTVNTVVWRGTFSVSLPGVPKHVLALPGGHIYAHNHARSGIPAIQRLVAFVLHPTFPWVSSRGEVGRQVESIRFRNYGVKYTPKGARMGRR